MKTPISKILAIAVAASVMSSGVLLADDANVNIPPAKATPGTPAESNSKTQENNPSGPTAQTTSHPMEGTKKKKKKKTTPDTSEVQTTASGDKATKTPQKDTPPSTPNP